MIKETTLDRIYKSDLVLALNKPRKGQASHGCYKQRCAQALHKCTLGAEVWDSG